MLTLLKNAIVGNTGQSFDAKRAAARTTKVTENPCGKNCPRQLESSKII